jgi:hypothetical protein
METGDRGALCALASEAHLRSHIVSGVPAPERERETRVFAFGSRRGVPRSQGWKDGRAEWPEALYACLRLRASIPLRTPDRVLTCSPGRNGSASKGEAEWVIRLRTDLFHTLPSSRSPIHRLSAQLSGGPTVGYRSGIRPVAGRVRALTSMIHHPRSNLFFPRVQPSRAPVRGSSGLRGGGLRGPTASVQSPPTRPMGGRVGVRKGAAWIRECPGERPSHGQVTPAGSRFRLLGGANRIDNPRSGSCLGAGREPLTWPVLGRNYREGSAGNGWMGAAGRR